MAAPTRLIFYTSSWSAVSSMALGSQCGCIASVIAPTLASFLVMGQGLGMSLGPFAGSLLYKVGFGNAILNGFTSPAWVMAVVWCIFWVCVRLFYVDIPKDAHHWGQIGQSTTSSAPKVLGALLSDSIMLEEKTTTPRPASTSSDTHSPTSNLSFLHKLLPMGRPRLYVLVRHDLFLHPRSLGIQSSRIRRIQTRIPLVTHRRRELHRARWHHCLPISHAQRISHSAYRGPCHTRYRIMPRSLLSSRFLISPTDRKNQLWKCIHVLVGYGFRTQHRKRRTR